MARRDDGVKEKNCGCVYFDYGPPVLCEKHASKAKRKAEREQLREEKGLRKLVADQARNNGHDLSRFKEYPSRPGKHTAHCHACGAIVIVYDQIPEFGDQVCGKGITEVCQRSALVGTLGEAEREAIASRFEGGHKPERTVSRDGEANGLEDNDEARDAEA